MSRQAHETENPDGRVRKLKSHAVGVAVPRIVIPKCRRRTLYVQLRQYSGEVFRRLAQQKECRVEEGHLMSDHVHMMLRIPPKYAVSQVVGYIKGKSAIQLAQVKSRTLPRNASQRETVLSAGIVPTF